MRTGIRMLSVAMSLAVLFWPVGCATKAPDAGSSKSDKQLAKQKEATGKVSFITPCRTLIEIELASSGQKQRQGDKAAKMKFYALDAEVRESARDIAKADVVRIQYVFNPDTKRNRATKIEKLAEKTK